MHILIVATTNKDKIREFSRLLTQLDFELKSLKDFGSFPAVHEDGHTFAENAAKKARSYFDYFKEAVIADDTGLVVPALHNEPGVQSARYAGKNADYMQNNRLLMERIKKIPPENRTAYFTCTICYKDEKHEKFFSGRTQGIILDELQGNEGFGYDPLFFVPERNKTYAQLTIDEKNHISHRGKAIQSFMKWAQNRFSVG